MLPGYQKIVEERIRKAQRQGEFENLPGSGKPLELQEEQHIPEDLRLAYKILKNADCLPPEIELKKEIHQTETLLAAMGDTAQKYKLLKKLNYMIMRLNAIRPTTIGFEMPQRYLHRLTERFGKNPDKGEPEPRK